MSSTSSNIPIFREYIGVKPVPMLDDFPDIVSKVKEFHFILGIATENYIDGEGTGNFKCTWNEHYFNKERVLAMKEKYSKITDVKVIISFGGLGDQHPFNPDDNNFLWIEKAYESIKAIINSYQITNIPTPFQIIDGIDINYEYIIPDDHNVFTSCISQLISKLKTDFQLSVSISPSKLVEPQYYSLYLNKPDLISWINYQFYLHPVVSKNTFVTLYTELVQKYPDQKFLPGVSTDPKTAINMKRKDFIEGIIELNSTKPLAGAFVWNANDSKVPPKPDESPFFLEKTIQEILNTP